jgi:FKBP-type peptidyl-prolyl cis-trans isomerase FkpA
MTLTPRTLGVALIAGLAVGITAACQKQDGGSGGTSGLDTDAQKFSYAVGVDIGKSLGQQKEVKAQIDLVALVDGIEETLGGQEPRLDDEAREKIKAEVSKQIQEAQMQERTAKAAAAKEAGEKFLAENGKREGVTTTASGLQYEMLSQGSGATPKATDKVTVHYKGTLIDGTEFDSSYARGQPVTFPLGNVIPGWTEGLQLLKAGGKAKLYIPAGLAYGERGAGAKIGPNETLVFEVELISVEKGDAPK